MKVGLGVVNLRTADIAKILGKKNFEKWLAEIPETARKNESTDVLVLVYLIEMLGGDENV